MESTKYINRPSVTNVRQLSTYIVMMTEEKKEVGVGVRKKGRGAQERGKNDRQGECTPCVGPVISE